MKSASIPIPRLILAAGLLVALGCDHGSNAVTPIGRQTSGVTNGSVVTPWAYGGGGMAGGPNTDFRNRAILRGHDSGGSCTGSLIAPSWVLTAEHCAFAAGAATFSSVRPSSFPGNDDPDCAAHGVTCVSRQVDAVLNSNLGDIALAHLSQPFTDIQPRSVYQGSEPAILNQRATCYGFSGGYTLTSGIFTTGPSQSVLGLSSDDPYFIAISSSAGQSLQSGDFGGPCILGSSIISTASTSALGATAAALRDFVKTPTQVQFTAGDFNGDGRADYVATTAAGSTFYFSELDGSFTTSSEPDLKLGGVMFTPGDFDGDLRTDLIVTTAAGSAWWYATPTEDLWDKRDPHTEWTYTAVQFTVANFDSSDRRADFIASTATDSSWYYATSSRDAFTNAFSRPDLALRAVSFVPADFDGDGRDDLIVSTSNGTEWLYGNRARTWDDAPDTNRPDLPIGAASFVTGDFDRDSRSDFVLTTPAGSDWYFATPTRTVFDTSSYYHRSDLALGSVKYVPADLNRDHRADLVIVTAAGSSYYLSTGRGSFDAATIPPRSDLSLGNVQYAPLDFDNDGRTDLLVTTTGGTSRSLSTGTELVSSAPDTSLHL